MVMYGVSRTVMREALRTLTSKAVESRPKIGTRVRPRGVWNLLDADLLDWYARVAPPIAFALKLQEMREMVEPYAAALAARIIRRRRSTRSTARRARWPSRATSTNGCAPTCAFT